MTQYLLEKQEIKELCKTLSQVFRHIEDLRKNSKIAQHIQFPKIPPKLSESIIVQLLREGILVPELSKHQISLGGRRADIIAKKSSQELKIEVKSTGKQDFQYFGDKDVSADYLIWLSFKDSFKNENFKEISVTIIQPKDVALKPGKITLKHLKNESGEKFEASTIDLEKWWK
jgi:hypothetical protein